MVPIRTPNQNNLTIMPKAQSTLCAQRTQSIIDRIEGRTNRIANIVLVVTITGILAPAFVLEFHRVGRRARTLSPVLLQFGGKRVADCAELCGPALIVKSCAYFPALGTAAAAWGVEKELGGVMAMALAYVMMVWATWKALARNREEDFGSDGKQKRESLG
ncbi:uncharacterized protein LTR77_011068 [Saxophila tyrrhenica]|uniref:Uncharacterized protein n=1 Tax=Saxophila tyrrhenica TaxID=1690608 RepID=A0AAV9NTX7_9PEZI|nr:hypothetical protein LTR77_011068 [Saxophila tyrrhenica]